MTRSRSLPTVNRVCVEWELHNGHSPSGRKRRRRKKGTKNKRRMRRKMTKGTKRKVRVGKG
jgi:hypothetical protein